MFFTKNVNKLHNYTSVLKSENDSIVKIQKKSYFTWLTTNKQRNLSMKYYIMQYYKRV